ncbi:MAG: ABC transporter ATP-binding protein/permease [Clostridia bacterium]|nr:ABC transporter ATP-binding protein/permease [Clostridia bacterium]
MIRLENVNKYFNRRKKNELHVINNISLTLGDSGLVALLGPSGSGKTTLLNAIGGLDKIGKGKIYINDQKITSKIAYKVDEIRNINIGYIFQDYKLIEDMSVFDNIAIVLKMIGIKDKNEIKTRVDYVLNSVNMYRYRNRPASMLSGGERQRVGIARAIVKDPDIIIADEPTGNLDSKNTIQIMNIIKSISKKRLVILVTHETELARFYASRIVEIQDGEIKKDYENGEIDELDYGLENKIFLKDFKEIEEIRKENIEVNCYSNNKEKIKINLIIKNGNIYIQSDNKEKIEVIDNNSNIEVVNEHYKKIDKKIYEEYNFNFDKAINKNIKKKYSSILNPVTLIIKGFRKVFRFSILKKLLLIGFLISSMFTMYSISATVATMTVKDANFIKVNRNYLQIMGQDIKIEDYLKYEKYDGVKYLLPGTSEVSLIVKYEDYYQTTMILDYIDGSLSGKSLIKEKDIIYGRTIQNGNEIILDKMVIDKMFSKENAKMAGVLKVDELLGKRIYVKNMEEFVIVGITDLQSPSIYVDESVMINVIASAEESSSQFNVYGSSNDIVFDTYENNSNEEYMNENEIVDYKALENDIELREGKMPNDYEIIVNISNKSIMPINQEIEKTVNGKNLKVVGYYDSKENINLMFTNNNTIKYNLIEKNSIITMAAEEGKKEYIITEFRNKDINIEDAYEYSKQDYLRNKQETMRSNLIVSGIMLGISLIEIYLMTRSSFLSRIKEIGIYRAIGVKKIDIYKMFIGEIIAITTIGSLPGIILMAYILKVLSTIPYMSNYFIINFATLGGTIIFVYAFNILVGLLPVFNVIRKRPAEILSRHDLD